MMMAIVIIRRACVPQYRFLHAVFTSIYSYSSILFPYMQNKLLILERSFGCAGHMQQCLKKIGCGGSPIIMFDRTDSEEFFTPHVDCITTHYHLPDLRNILARQAPESGSESLKHKVLSAMHLFSNICSCTLFKLWSFTGGCIRGKTMKFNNTGLLFVFIAITMAMTAAAH